MTTLPIAELRKNLGEFLARAAFGGERIIVAKNGKPIAAVVSLEDLKKIEKYEDRIDIGAADAVMESGEFVPYEDVRKELGLDR